MSQNTISKIQLSNQTAINSRKLLMYLKELFVALQDVHKNYGIYGHGIDCTRSVAPDVAFDNKEELHTFVAKINTSPFTATGKQSGKEIILRKEWISLDNTAKKITDYYVGLGDDSFEVKTNKLTVSFSSLVFTSKLGNSDSIENQLISYRLHGSETTREPRHLNDVGINLEDEGNISVQEVSGIVSLLIEKKGSNIKEEITKAFS